MSVNIGHARDHRGTEPGDGARRRSRSRGVEEAAILKRLYGLIKYNRDWFPYLLRRYQHSSDGRLTAYRLRNGQTVTLKNDGRFILNEIFLDRVYDVPGTDISSCRSVLDVGANVGVFALYMASRAPEATIHCFEPGSSNFEILQRNLTRAGIRATVHKLAMSASPGAGYLTLQGTSVEYSLGAAGNHSEKVECVDWANALRLAGVECFDFVKMDIEGTEREILTACTDAQLQQMRVLSLEWHHSREELEALAARFRGLGFDTQAQIFGDHRYLKARRA
jgi:FkbM family methyltransferase